MPCEKGIAICQEKARILNADCRFLTSNALKRFRRLMLDNGVDKGKNAHSISNSNKCPQGWDDGIVAFRFRMPRECLSFALATFDWHRYRYYFIFSTGNYFLSASCKLDVNNAAIA
jgi:hypothetical protein